LAAVSGLETLPPDQRAVLQLILVQGRGYADLAGVLALDVAAVRDRAVAGLDALGIPGGTALDAIQRARIADYLLGQQDAGERIVTFAELGESADACRWAQALRERLAPIAHAPLPDVPASATPSPNGSTPAPVAATPAEPATSVAPAAPAPAAAPAKASTTSRPSSRPGGAILLAGVAALVIVLAIVLFSGGDNGKPSSAASSTATSSQTQARTQPTGTSTTPASAANIVGQANLTATPAGGQAVGVGLVQRSGSKSILALEAQKLPANGAQEIYAVWLQGSPGSHFLGFVPHQVKANGTFTVSADVPSNVRSYATVLVTHEPITATTAPTQPGTAVLSGPLRFR
jgi:hypothetical protein